MNKHTISAIVVSGLAMLSLGLGASAQRISDLPKPRPNVQATKIVDGRKAGDKLSSLQLDVLTMYLKLTKEQSDKIAPILKKVQGDMVGFLDIGRNPAAADQTKIIAQVKALGGLIEQSDKDIEAALTENQKKKVDPMFEEIRLLNSVGVSRAGIAAVKLTDDQKKQILSLAEDYQKKRQELKPEERPTKGVEMARDYRGKAAALLTDDQKQALEKAKESDPFNRKPKTP